MNCLPQLGLISLIVLLTACSGGTNEHPTEQPNTTVSTQYDGIWLSEPYGKGLNISNGNISQFDYTSNFCLLDDTTSFEGESDLLDYFTLSSDKSELYFFAEYGISQFHAPTPPYVKMSQLPAACGNGYDKRISDAGYVSNPIKDAEIFFETFKEYYLDFSLSNTDWDQIYEQAISQVSTDTSNEQLFEIFYEAISYLADTHVSVTSDNLGTASINNKPVFWEVLLNEYLTLSNLTQPLTSDKIQEANQYIDDNLSLYKQIISSYAEDVSSIKTYGEDALTWFKNGDIGYLAINRMLDLSDNPTIEKDIKQAKEGITQVLVDLIETSALIVDVRLNNGGRDAVSMMYAKHLITQGGVLATKESTDISGNYYTLNYELYPAVNAYQKPIFILTSASTVSAAEAFVLMMKSQPNVTIIGENTQGALSDALSKKIPNGFQFNLSNEKYLSVDGEWFEKIGIPPDIEIPFLDLTSRQREKDNAIEAVISLLN